LQAERVLPVATDLLCQFNPGIVDQDAAIGALELIATEIAPAVGWRPDYAEPVPAAGPVSRAVPVATDAVAAG